MGTIGRSWSRLRLRPLCAQVYAPTASCLCYVFKHVFIHMPKYAWYFINKDDDVCLKKCDGQLLQIATPFLIQSATRFITHCDRYYKVRWIYYKLRQVLQSAMIITNCDSTPVRAVFLFFAYTKDLFFGVISYNLLNLLSLKSVKKSAIWLKIFWYKGFVHWELKLLNFLMNCVLNFAKALAWLITWSFKTAV